MKTISTNIFIVFITLVLFYTSKNNLYAQEENSCHHYPLKRVDFNARVDFAKTEIIWFPEWIEANNGKKDYPKPLPVLDKWKHPRFNNDYPFTMHEDSYSSDVSNFPGPIPDGVKVQYFHVLEKGKKFSGMAPTFNFISKDTLLTLSFGRSQTHLLLIYAGDTIKLLDAIEVPGREYSAMSLMSKKKRLALFRNTMGGAYSYLSKDKHMFIPGANNDIIRVPVKFGKFDLNNVDYIDVTDQMERGNILDKELKSKAKTNHLTAIMPDKYANVWYTSQQGIVGVVHHKDRINSGCLKVYSEFIASIGLVEKLNYYKNTNYKNYKDLPDFILNAKKMSPELRKKFKEYYHIKNSNFEQIQNSFAVGKDGVYVVTDLALYKLIFNEETKGIELDPEWKNNFKGGGLIYDNDFIRKPGHLNAGSGTSPTLMDNRFVAIVDNAARNVNICIFSQKTGKLINKFPLFTLDQSACENSIIAYKNSFIVANTYGYVDPFNNNDTPGGIMRFDFNEETGRFERKLNWPDYDYPLDLKTATPKLSTSRGLVYFYNREDKSTSSTYRRWQVSTLDFKSGKKVFSIIPYFEEGGFNDNVKGLVLKMSLGKENYDLKVFNNLWGTFEFGPENSLYIGAYRGFVRFSSH